MSEAFLGGDFKLSRDELVELVKERDFKRFKELGGTTGIATALGSDVKNGLSEHEASTGFASRKARFGENLFPQKDPKAIWVLIWEALQDRTLQILIVAALVSIILGVTVGHGGDRGHGGSTGSGSASASGSASSSASGSASGSASSSASGSAPVNGSDSSSASSSASGSDSSSYYYPDEPASFMKRMILSMASASGSDSGSNGPAEPPGWLEGVAILVAVALVVTVTATNDYNKEKQFRKLSAQNDDQMVKVTRGGHATTVNINDIVVGDIVFLESGDTIPADGLYIQGFSISCDESAMTGEPELVAKDEDEDPWFLSNCRIMEGRGTILIIAVGPYSQWGVIKMGLDTDHEDTPLQEKLETLADDIGKLGLVAAGLTLIALIINRIVVVQRDPNIDWTWSEFNYLVDYFIIAVTIIVVAVPEGLPLAVTISLAYSMKKMMNDNNLVRHLAACETMGGATNICSDKTGTLTENRMTVMEGWLAGRPFNAENPDKFADDVEFLFCENAALNSSAYIEIKDGVKHFIGNKTECAVIEFIASKMNFDWDGARKKTEIIKVFPFSSTSKQMSTVVQAGSDRVRLHKKGAPENVLAGCSHVLDQNAQIVPLTDQSRAELLRKIEDAASHGLRTLGLAYAEYLAPVSFAAPPEEGLIFIGFVGIKDPVRKEVPPAVALCRSAGITVRMVTGDNILTAEHIAKECGILSADGICIEGPKFRKLSTKELDAMLPRLQVIARASPEDKLKLVQRLKALGEVVASTGDGTNDALQLKEADVGFSMGITGTGVAKEASDIILLDDNFASIAKACMWGRNVYDSIRKFLQFQLTVNVGAVIIAFVGAVVPSIGDSPLSAVQMLWVNLIMDTMAALALATEPPSPTLLERPPYGRYDSLITNSMKRMIVSMCIYQLTILFVLLFCVQDFSFAFGDIDVTTDEGKLTRGTIIFNTFVLCQLVNEINARKLGDELNVFSGFWNNYLFIGILIFSFFVQFLMVQIPSNVVPSSGLTFQQWISCGVIALASLPYCLIVKVCIKVSPDQPGKPPEEETPLLSSNRSIIPIFSKWGVARRVIKELRVINAFRRVHR